MIDWVNSAEGRGGSGAASVRCGHTTRSRGCLKSSTSRRYSDLHLPDNVTVSANGTLVFCEDNAPPTPRQQQAPGSHARGQLITLAEHLERPAVESAGATLSPGGTTLYANLNTGSALSVAIWGPWETVGV